MAREKICIHLTGNQLQTVIKAVKDHARTYGRDCPWPHPNFGKERDDARKLAEGLEKILQEAREGS